MSSEADTTSATATVATPTKVAAAGADSTSPAPSTPSKEVDEARTELAQGRRHLLVKDYFSAVACLAKACEKLAQKFGDTAPELGDAYLTYGRALLELARTESGVLGMNEDAEAEGEEDEDDEEGEEGEEEEKAEENGAEAEKEGEKNGKEEEKAAATNGKSDAEAEAKVEGATSNGTEKKAEDKEEKANGVEENGEEEEAKPAEPDQTLKEEDEEDDVNNLQLAWEVLELAKSIFVRLLEAEGAGEAKQLSLKLAEVYLKLGEVGVESENYTTAVEDMKACLELQRRFLDEDDRRVAETLYTMGVAYSLANEFDSAIEQFKLASAQIEKRIATLEKKATEPAAAAADAASADDPFYTVQGEIDELKALLPEMKEKVSDMQDFKKETVRRMMDGLAEASAKQSSTADGAGPSSAADKPVSSVAHLVKRKPKEEAAPVVEEAEKEEAKDLESSLERKRKPEDSVEAEDSSKKAKVEEEDSTESEPVEK